MLVTIKQQLLNNLSLKVLALVFGYIFWTTMSERHVTQVTLNAPVSFFHQEGLVLDAPEAISVTLAAPRKKLYGLTRDLALHIDAQKLTQGKNTVRITEQNLFLPPSVKLIHYTPEKIAITVSQA